MQPIERLNVDVSYYANQSDKHSKKTANLWKLLTGQFTTKHHPQLEKVRAEKDYSKRSELKKALPAFTVTGVFSQRGSDFIDEWTGLAGIDIDFKNNKHIKNPYELKKHLCRNPYVLYGGYSCSNEGLFLIIEFDSLENYTLQYNCIIEDFLRCGIKIDTGCKDLARLRYLSDDPDPYTNANAALYTRLPVEKPKRMKNTPQITEEDKANIKKCVDYICGELINIADDYDDWFELGCSLASGLGEEGREYFHDISAMSGKYKPFECDKKYNECLKADRTNIGKFFNICKQYNVKYINL
jgi:hypothetical protein